ADRAGSGEHSQRELAGGCRIADRKISARNQRSLACNRRNAVRLENLRAKYLWCRGARAAAIAFGEPIKKRDIPRITRASILNVEPKLPHCPRAIVAGPVFVITRLGATIVIGGVIPDSPGNGW